MAGKTKDMSDVRKVLQLHEQKVSNRKVAKQLGLDKNTVNRYIATLSNLNMKVSDLLRMEDPELEKMFFSGSPAYTDERMDTFLEELPYYRDQLKDKHVTRLLLYEEYKARHPEGYGKSQFFYHLSQNLVAQKGPTAVLTYTYDPGTYLFVDFAGDKLSYIDPTEPVKSLRWRCLWPVCLIPAMNMPSAYRHRRWKTSSMPSACVWNI